jgi:hypothetical protein
MWPALPSPDGKHAIAMVDRFGRAPDSDIR